MRAVIERNTESGTDEYSHPLPPVFATLHAALPCWVWSTSRRTVVDGDKTAIVEDVRALFPRAADVAEGDQVASIKDRQGNVVMAGRFEIEAVQFKHRHQEAALLKVA